MINKSKIVTFHFYLYFIEGFLLIKTLILTLIVARLGYFLILNSLYIIYESIKLSLLESEIPQEPQILTTSPSVKGESTSEPESKKITEGGIYGGKLKKPQKNWREKIRLK